VFHASFSADSRRVVTASRDGTARVWHTATGEPVTPPLKHRGEVGHAEFSPDARRVVTASTDRTVRVWDASTGEPVTPALKHSDVVRQASFSPNGRFVITAGGDAAQVWDLTPHAGPVSDLTLLAQVVVGHSLSSAGDRPLDSKRFRDAYPRLRSSYPDDFARCRTLHN
jgi:WD40 repeat protein